MPVINSRVAIVAGKARFAGLNGVTRVWGGNEPSGRTPTNAMCGQMAATLSDSDYIEKTKEGKEEPSRPCNELNT